MTIVWLLVKAPLILSVARLDSFDSWSVSDNVLDPPVTVIAVVPAIPSSSNSLAVFALAPHVARFSVAVCNSNSSNADVVLAIAFRST